MRTLLSILISCSVFASPSVTASSQWRAFTVDNDIFVGNDSGYSNGFYYSWISPVMGNERREAPILVTPLLWSLDDQVQRASVISSTIGQTLNTPEDITIEDPAEDELPYSGLLFFNQTFLSIKKGHADKLSTTVGLVGPSSGAEASQKLVHSITGSDKPKGWDTQLKDELVFDFRRGRVWRSWHSDNERFDLLLDSEASLGTLISAISVGATFRYGRVLSHSYASHLFDRSRTSNPVAIDRGWYFYAAIQASYIFNQIFTDGNTFRDSRSIDVDPESIGVGIGYAYSWDDLSVTFAINDFSIERGSSEEQLEDLTRYGTLTVAWRY